MVKPSGKFKLLINQIFTSVIKQKITFITSVLAAVAGILSIYEADWPLFDEDLYIHLCYSFLMACAFSLPVGYLTKKLASVEKYIVQSLSAVISGTGAYLIFYFEEYESYQEMYYLGIMFAVVAFTIFLFTPKENSKAYYSNILKNFFFCGLISLILFLGLVLLVYAFDNLIHEIDDFGEFISSIALVCFIVFYINLFTFYLYEKREEPSGKAVQIIFLYTLFPVFLVLIAVLYAYLIKALCLFKLPQGQMNWFVSFATVFYIIFYFILREYEDKKAVKLFYKYGALFLIPLICVQIPAYCIRVSAYGFTGWRFSSLLYTIFATATIISTFIKKGKYTQYAILVLTVFILIASVSPFNLIKVGYSSQFNRMKKILSKYEMFDGESLTNYDKDKIGEIITDEDNEQLYEAFHYLDIKDFHNKPEWLQTDESYNQIFGLTLKKNSSVSTYTIINSQKSINIDITPYTNFCHFSKYNNNGSANKIIAFDSQEYDITDFVLSNTKRIDEDYLLYHYSDNVDLYFTYLHYSYDKEKKSFINISYEGYAFKKIRKSDIFNIE